MTSRRAVGALHSVANAERPESLEDSGRSTHALPTTTGLSLAPTEVSAREGVATASSDNRTASHSADSLKGDREPLHVLTHTIAAGVADARPTMPQITGASPVDRTGCRGASHGQAHGTASAATKGCRCADARRALSRIRYLRATGRVPMANTTGLAAQRAARALAAAGWTLTELAAELDATRQHVNKLMHCHDRGQQIRHTSNDTLTAAYRRLAHQPGPGLTDAYWAAVATAGAVPATIAARVAGARHAVLAAAAAGWATAADWAGIDLNDPGAQPRPAARIPISYARPSWVAQFGLPPLDRDQPGRPPVAHRAGAPLRVDGRNLLTDQDVWAVRDHWVADVTVGRLTAAQLAAGYGITDRILADIVTGVARPHLRLPNLIDHGPRLGGRAQRSAYPTRAHATTGAVPGCNRPGHDQVDPPARHATPHGPESTLTSSGRAALRARRSA